MIDLTPLCTVIDVKSYSRMADGIRVIGHGLTKIPFIGVELNTYVDFVYTDSMIHLYSRETQQEIACKQLVPAERSDADTSLYSSFMDITEIPEYETECLIAKGRTKINIGDVPSGTYCFMAIVYNKGIVQLHKAEPGGLAGDLLAEVKIKLVLA